jgi:glycosyltransferase 2 family protein
MTRRLWLRAVIGIAVSAGFIVATMSQVDLTLLGEAWAAVGLVLLGTAVLIAFVEVCVRAMRWRILLRPLAPAGFGTTLGFLVIGHLANAVLPARLGDIARALLTGTRLRASRTSVLGTIAVERVSDALLLSLAVTAGVILGYRQLAPAAATIGIAGLAVGVVTVVIVLVLGRNRVTATRGGALLRRQGLRFASGASALRDPVHAAKIVLLTGVSFVLAVSVLHTVATAVGLVLPIWQSALIIAAVTLSTAIPAGPASIGTYEFVGVTIMTAMGFPAEQSLLCVALVHAVVVLTPSTLGLGALWWMGVRPLSGPLGAGIRQAQASERST